MSLAESKDFHVVEDAEKGNGLFASRRFARGERIYSFDYWSAPVMPMHMTNHSCEPNASFEDGELIALRDLEAGEEITYDYLLHPVPASPWNFKCCCNASSCVGWVQAA